MLSTEPRAAFAANGWLVIRGAVGLAPVQAVDAVIPDTQLLHSL